MTQSICDILYASSYTWHSCVNSKTYFIQNLHTPPRLILYVTFVCQFKNLFYAKLMHTIITHSIRGIRVSIYNLLYTQRRHTTITHSIRRPLLILYVAFVCQFKTYLITTHTHHHYSCREVGAMSHITPVMSHVECFISHSEWGISRDTGICFIHAHIDRYSCHIE